MQIAQRISATLAFQAKKLSACWLNLSWLGFMQMSALLFCKEFEGKAWPVTCNSHERDREVKCTVPVRFRCLSDYLSRCRRKNIRKQILSAEVYQHNLILPYLAVKSSLSLFTFLSTELNQNLIVWSYLPFSYSLAVNKSPLRELHKCQPIKTKVKPLFPK